MKNVAIIYPYFAHYRGPIIEELLNDNVNNYYFFAGENTNSAVSSLKLYDFRQNSNFVRLKNVWFLKYFLLQFGIISELKKRNIETVVLLSDWKYVSYWFLILYCKLSKRKCLFWSHGLLNNDRTINNRIKILFHSLFDGGVVYSERAKNLMLSVGFVKPIYVINNSLDYYNQQKILSTISENHNKVKLPIENPYIIFSGRLIAERKLELLFEALNHLEDRKIVINVLIVGTGPHESKLKDFVKKYKFRSRIVFYGSCYDEKLLGSFYMNALACVYPGSIGLTVIHSLTYGIPVVTHNNLDKQKPEIEALIDGKNGFLFDENNSKDLAAKIEKVFVLSPSDRLSFSQCGMSVVRSRYTPYFQKTILENIINDI